MTPLIDIAHVIFSYDNPRYDVEYLSQLREAILLLLNPDNVVLLGWRNRREDIPGMVQSLLAGKISEQHLKINPQDIDNPLNNPLNNLLNNPDSGERICIQELDKHCVYHSPFRPSASEGDNPKSLIVITLKTTL